MASICWSNPVSAVRRNSGSASIARLPNVPVIDLGRRRPNPLAMLRALLISNVRARRIASRARITANSVCCSALRCSTGASSRTSARASRASLRASTGSFLVSLEVIHFSSRGLATITSCPSCFNSRLIQADCAPASSAIRRGSPPKCVSDGTGLVAEAPFFDHVAVLDRRCNTG